MDLTFTDDQRAITDLAASVFAGEVDLDRIRAAEATTDTIDRELWHTLAATGLLGVGAPERQGGTGGGAVETCCVLEQHGRSVAPLPLARTFAALATIAAHGSPEQCDEWIERVVGGLAVLSTGIDLSGLGYEVSATATDGSWRLDGLLPSVHAATAADALLVEARPTGEPTRRLFLVRPTGPGVRIERAITTNRIAHAHVALESAPAEPIGSDAAAVQHLATHLRLALAATALGVAEEALARAAAYTSQRHQFGKPLSSFQSTAHRAADCYIDVEAMRATLWQAAWLTDEGDRAAVDAALVAAWWAADAGARVVQSVQHLHGGLGADTDYPVHRFYLWGTQLDIELGGASALLAQIGDGIAVRAHDRTNLEEAAR